MFWVSTTGGCLPWQRHIKGIRFSQYMLAEIPSSPKWGNNLTHLEFGILKIRPRTFKILVEESLLNLRKLAIHVFCEEHETNTPAGSPAQPYLALFPHKKNPFPQLRTLILGNPLGAHVLFGTCEFPHLTKLALWFQEKMSYAEKMPFFPHLEELDLRTERIEKPSQFFKHLTVKNRFAFCITGSIDHSRAAYQAFLKSLRKDSWQVDLDLLVIVSHYERVGRKFFEETKESLQELAWKGKVRSVSLQVIGQQKIGQQKVGAAWQINHFDILHKRVKT